MIPNVVTDTHDVVTDALNVVTDDLNVVTDDLNVVTDTHDVVTDALNVVIDTPDVVTDTHIIACEIVNEIINEVNNDDNNYFTEIGLGINKKRPNRKRYTCINGDNNSIKKKNIDSAAYAAYEYYLAERYLQKRRMLYNLKRQLEEYKESYKNYPNTATFLKIRGIIHYFQ